MATKLQQLETAQDEASISLQMANKSMREAYAALNRAIVLAAKVNGNLPRMRALTEKKAA